jgi:hypothetical protein
MKQVVRKTYKEMFVEFKNIYKRDTWDVSNFFQAVFLTPFLLLIFLLSPYVRYFFETRRKKKSSLYGVDLNQRGVSE